MFVQMDELPSMYSRPLLSRSNAPRPSTKTSGSCSRAHHSRMSVNGCQTNRLSASISSSVFHSAIIALECADMSAHSKGSPLHHGCYVDITHRCVALGLVSQSTQGLRPKPSVADIFA